MVQHAIQQQADLMKNSTEAHNFLYITMVKAVKRLKHIFKKLEKKQRTKTGRDGYHGGIFRGSFHEKWHGDLKLPEQLSVDGGLKEAVEVFSVWEAQQVQAVTFRNWHGVQQQVHQSLALQRIKWQHSSVENLIF